MADPENLDAQQQDAQTPQGTPVAEPQPAPAPPTEAPRPEPSGAVAAQARKAIDHLKDENSTLKAELEKMRTEQLGHQQAQHEIVKMEVLDELRVPLGMRQHIKGQTREEIRAEVEAWRTAFVKPEDSAAVAPEAPVPAPVQQTVPPVKPDPLAGRPPVAGPAQPVDLKSLPPRERVKLGEELLMKHSQEWFKGS